LKRTISSTGSLYASTSNFTGEKAQWLDSFCNVLRDPAGDAGGVYTNTMKVFLLQYGYDLPFAENVDSDPENHPPVIPANPDPEEKEHCAAVYKQLCMASFFSLELILHDHSDLTWP
jgi:hypothetical protein